MRTILLSSIVPIVSSLIHHRGIRRPPLFQFQMSTFTGITTFLCDFDYNVLHEDISADKDRLMEMAKSMGVKWFVAPGSCLSSSSELLQLANSDNDVVVTAGVHPYNTAKDILSDESLSVLRLLLQSDRCYAVGECGLDYSPGFPAKDIQLPWFKAQLSLAIEYQMPLYLHSRAAKDDFVTVLSEFGFGPANIPPVPVCVHCFTGDTEELRIYLDSGYYIGLTGFVVTMDKNKLNEWLQLITLDRLVIETDAPYMGWKGCRKTEAKGKDRKYPNVPSSLFQVLDCIVQVSGWERQEIINKTTQNGIINILKVYPVIPS